MQLNPRSPLTPFPRGWYLAAFSHELKPGEVKPVRYFGREIVLFRTTDGVAHAFDAYCPHLGSHLGHGGTVEGNCLRCPFHGWQYDGESGRCTSIPYAQKIPPNARAGTWPLNEVSGMLMIWFHEAGGAPNWHVPEVYDRADDANWTEWKETRWTLRAVIQDLSENDIDSAHLPNLHRFTRSMPTSEIGSEGARFDVKMTVSVNMETFGMPGEATGPIHTTKYGLGLGYIHVNLEPMPGVRISSRTLGNTTPIDAEHVDVRLLHSIRKTPFEQLNQQLETSYFAEFKRTVDQDIVIWTNKIHLAKPLLCEGDGPIAQYRKWARQFYSEEEVAKVYGTPRLVESAAG